MIIGVKVGSLAVLEALLLMPAAGVAG